MRKCFEMFINMMNAIMYIIAFISLLNLYLYLDTGKNLGYFVVYILDYFG